MKLEFAEQRCHWQRWRSHLYSRYYFAFTYSFSHVPPCCGNDHLSDQCHNTIFICLAPNCSYSVTVLENLFRQFIQAFLLLGDFNLHYPLWNRGNFASPTANCLVEFTDRFSQGCLNTGIPTCERLGTRISSFTDVSFCSHLILDRLLYLLVDYHYLIVIDSSCELASSRYNRVDWASFCYSTTFNIFLYGERFPAVAETFGFYFRRILSAAMACIRRTIEGRKPVTPW